MMKPHLFVAGVGWISRFVFVLVGMASIRLLSTILGPNDYAAFSVLYGLAGWFALGDLGLGPGLQNALSHHRAQNKDPSHIIASALLILVVLFFIEIILLFCLSPFLGTWVLGKLLFSSACHPKDVFLVGGIFLTITGLASIQYRIWFAEKIGYLSHIVPTIGQVISYLLVSCFISPKTPNKLWWTLILFLAPSGLLPLFSLVKKFHFEILMDTASHFKNGWLLLRQSRGFFLFSIMAAAVLNVDNIVASQFLPANEIVGYNVLNKVFGFGLFGYSAVLTALWPELSEAFAKGHRTEIFNRVKTHLLVGIFAMAIFCLIISIFSNKILAFLCPTISWQPTTALLLFLSLYQLTRVWTDTFAIVLQSTNRVTPLLFWVPIQAISGCLLQVALAPKLGASGISLGILGSFLLTVTWALPKSAIRIIFSPVHSG